MTASTSRPLGGAPPDLAPGADRRRLVGPDVVRAVALIGVVTMNYHGYLIIRGGTGAGTDGWEGVFDPWTGPLATRFAATFVLTAGVGVTLLTRGAAGDPAAVRARRWTLVRRGTVLYAGGLLLDVIWPGTILPYYGAMFVLAAVLFTLPSAAVLAIGVGAAVAGAGNAWWAYERAIDGVTGPTPLAAGSGSPRQWVADVLVNGTHPLLPWLMFFCAGIVLGRQLRRPGWATTCAVAGLLLFFVAHAVPSLVGDTPRADVLTSTDPFDRGLLYTASALGTALVAFAVISSLAEQFSGRLPIELLRHAGAMSLTLYVLHALVFELVVDQLGWIEPGGLGTALWFAAAFWVVAIAAGWWYHRRFGIGPLEWAYRRLGG